MNYDAGCQIAAFINVACEYRAISLDPLPVSDILFDAGPLTFPRRQSEATMRRIATILPSRLSRRSPR